MVPSPCFISTKELSCFYVCFLVFSCSVTLSELCEFEQKERGEDGHKGRFVTVPGPNRQIGGWRSCLPSH